MIRSKVLMLKVRTTVEATVFCVAANWVIL